MVTGLQIYKKLFIATNIVFPQNLKCKVHFNGYLTNLNPSITRRLSQLHASNPTPRTRSLRFLLPVQPSRNKQKTSLVCNQHHVSPWWRCSAHRSDPESWSWRTHNLPEDCNTTCSGWGRPLHSLYTSRDLLGQNLQCLESSWTRGRTCTLWEIKWE